MQGTFDLDSDQEITLFPDTGPRVEFEYSIPDSLNAELRLSAEDGVSEDQFLNLIQLRIQGAVDRVEVHLSKGGTASATVGSPSVPFKGHVAGIYAAEGERLWEGE